MKTIFLILLFFQDKVHNLIKDDELVLQTLESEDFGLWFIGAFTVAFFRFVEAKNRIEKLGKSKFSIKIYIQADWEDLLWVFVGSFGLLIVFGFTGKALFINEVVSKPAGGYGAEASFIIGLTGAYLIGKILEKLKQKENGSN